MKILFLCHRYLDTQIGGMAEFLHFLPKSLQNQGIESIVYTQSEKKTDKISDPITLPNGITCYTGPFVKPSLFTSNKKLFPLLDLCEDQKIDLIHAQGVYRSGYMALKAFQKSGIPYLVTSHSDILTAGSERMKRGKVQSRCIKVLKFSKGATHLTPMMAKVANDIFDTSDKSMIIGNGIDTQAWEQNSTLTEQNYLLSIGRLEKEKGFHILIDAFASLMKQGRKTSLIIAGSGSEEKNLQQQAEQLGLNVVTQFKDDAIIPESSIVFTGYINGKTKMRLISQAQAILFAPQPAIWEEPFGIVQLEAMAAGKPLIASDTYASRYLQKSGLQAALVKADDAQAWANEISTLLDNTVLKQNMGLTNLQHAKTFDWEIIAKKYAGFYQKLV